MSRRDQIKKPKLPRELLDRLGGDESNGKGKRKGGRSQTLNRKDRRRAEREEKKSHRRQPRTNGRPLPRSGAKHNVEGDVSEELFDSEADREFMQHPKQAKEVVPPTKSILKKAPRKAPSPSPSQSSSDNEDVSDNDGSDLENDSDDDLDLRSRKTSPGFRAPRQTQAQLDEDDAEVAALEKKLGLKGKSKASKTPNEDGLDDLLDGLDDIMEGSGTKRKREYEDFLQGKRKKVQRNARVNDLRTGKSDPSTGRDFDGDSDDASAMGEDDPDQEAASEDDDEADVYSEDDVESDFDEDDDGLDNESGDFDGFSEEEDRQPRQRENPYRAPVASDGGSSAKYVPPSLRGPSTSDSEVLRKLKRQLQGLLNKLSDANLLTILKEVEQVYANNARQYVTSTLIDLLMALICDRTSLLDTFIILHAGFVAAVNKVVGAQFGAQLLERMVADFDRYYADQKEKESTSKEAANLVALLAELYTFQVVNSNMIFDFIRFLLGELTDFNTELLLKIIRNCGSQLRQDNTSALKDIAGLLEKSANAVGEAKLSVRTKFMIETINNLKNNRQKKTGVAASQMVSEHTIRMKKTIGTLNTRSMKTTEPLGIGLDDIRNSKKEGKWWLVGASWRNETADSLDDTVGGHADQERSAAKRRGGNATDAAIDDDDAGLSIDIDSLARSLGINNPIRRAIFTTLTTSVDHVDAWNKLQRLRLKRSQEGEIPPVLLRLAGSEGNYNPYYTNVAKKCCNADPRMKKAFQFALWGLFDKLGEKGGRSDEQDDDDGESELDLMKLITFGKLYGELIAAESFPITVLKVLDLPLLQPRTKVLLEVMLITVFEKAKSKANATSDSKGRSDREKAVMDIFSQVKEAPQMARQLQYFLEKVVIDSDILPDGEKERKRVRRGCKTAIATLSIIAKSEVVG